jgi:filamentous hemagglutinin
MLKKSIAWLLIYGMTFSPALAGAQIRADQTAPGNQQPQVLSTMGGVPQVNINTPNQAGLSHNKYQQFDVDRRGAILNNSTRNVQTQLGGWIEGNPNLAGGSARTILNEVNSSQPSQLKGFVEVGGRKADVIIANPSGIQVDGGGFINAGQATLTTGRPRISGGDVTGYRVEGGHIEISGQGLSGRDTDYTAIISQSAALNAGVWAKDLTVTTGRNTVSRDGSRAAPLDPNAEDIQGVALDVAALGGMYAGHIKLIGTDKGLGVRNAGEIVAQVGEVVVTQEGRLENSGTISGKKAARITSKSAVKNTGRIQSAGAVSVKAKALDNAKEIIGAKRADIQAERVDNSGEILAETSVINAGELLHNTGRIQSAETASITVKTLENAKGIIEAGRADIQAGRVDNSGEILTDTSVINAGEALRNTGRIQSAEAASIKTKDLDNAKGNIEAKLADIIPKNEPMC